MVKRQYDIFLRNAAGKVTGTLYRRAAGDFNDVAKQIIASLFDYDAHFQWHSVVIDGPGARAIYDREQARRLLV